MWFNLLHGIPKNSLNSKPLRLTLPDTPAPTSRVLQEEYYLNINKIVNRIFENIN